MLAPKKTKHRKWQNARKSPAKLALPDTRGVTVAFGSFGLKALGPARVTANQIESARKVISRTSGKTGKMWIRIFPDRPITKKPAEVRMGSGKGDLDHYVCDVRPGRIIFEIDGTNEAIAREAMRKAGTKMPMKTKIVTR